MNTHINPTKVTGTPCSCRGSSKPCKCGGGGGCDCGGKCGCGATCTVDTMVRPRFFAGQLLTEDDLQSLEDYVIAKNRLHNRHFFGAGVVCGLQVLCDPCGGSYVAVTPGYALDCCGNDIVLGCRLTLDINEMVRDLRRDKLGGYDCGDPCSEQQLALAKEQGHPPRQYCLYVRYCEQETEPVSPYAVDEPCNPQTCEPSRVREGIRFELRCEAPPRKPNDLLAALETCFADILDIDKMSSDGLFLTRFDRISALVLREYANAAQGSVAVKTFEDLRARLLRLVERSTHLAHCKLRSRLLALHPPASAPPAVDVKSPPVNTPSEDSRELVAILREILIECACMSVNPPCPPCDDTAVLLACLTVQECEVVEICNMERSFVVTPTALRYWLGIGEVEALIARVCCPERHVGYAGAVPAIDRSNVNVSEMAADNALERGAPRDPVAAEPMAAPELRLQAMFTALAGLQRPESRRADSFARVAKTFGIFAGEPVDVSDKAKSKETKSDEPARSTAPAEAERAALHDALVAEMKATIGPTLTQAQKAIEQLGALQTQVDALTRKLQTRATRSPKKETGEINE
jgi:hypothetical protein